MNESLKTKAMFILYRTAFAWARKSYRIGLLTTHKNGDFGAIFCNGAKLRCHTLVRYEQLFGPHRK